MNRVISPVIVVKNFSSTMSMSPVPQGSLQIKWDPKNLEIRTKSVEKTLEPLVTQVSLSFTFFPMEPNVLGLFS